MGFPPLQMFCYLTMSATSVTFLLMWEHSHYVLFVQGLCLFLLDSFDLVPPRKVTTTSLTARMKLWTFGFLCVTCFCSFVSFLILDGRYQQGLPQLSDPGVLVAVSERDVAHLATPEPPDWLGARQVLPGKVWEYVFNFLFFHFAYQQIQIIQLNQFLQSIFAICKKHLSVKDLIYFGAFVAAKDEDRTSCGSSTEALPPLSSSLHHRNHIQLLAQGKVRKYLTSILLEILDHFRPILNCYFIHRNCCPSMRVTS